MNRFSHFYRGIPVFLLLFMLTSCTRSGTSGRLIRGQTEPQSEYIMGTICTIDLFEKGNSVIYAKVFNRLKELENIFSANIEGTDLDRVNKSAGLSPVEVRPELIIVLGKALEYAEKSDGLFDPSIGPLVNLWGIGRENAGIPEKDEILKALDLVNFREVEIEEQNRTVFLKRAGMALDLGAIAKGYAADEIVILLSGEGVERAIIDLGGNIFAMGEKKNTKKLGDRIKDLFSGGSEKTGGEDGYWRIGIQDPREGRGNYTGILLVKNKTVVTSGIYERYFEEGGRYYHHILSTETGFPVENNLLSVTIAADSSIDADALSTSAFALGWEKGRDLIESADGAAGIFVFNDLTLRLTSGIEEFFILTAMEYTLYPSPPILP